MAATAVYNLLWSSRWLLVILCALIKNAESPVIFNDAQHTQWREVARRFVAGPLLETINSALHISVHNCYWSRRRRWQFSESRFKALELNFISSSFGFVCSVHQERLGIESLLRLTWKCNNPSDYERVNLDRPLNSGPMSVFGAWLIRLRRPELASSAQSASWSLDIKGDRSKTSKHRRRCFIREREECHVWL